MNKCIYCHKKFVPRFKRQKCCGKICKKKWMSRLMKESWKSKDWSKRNRRISQALRGKKLSKKHRARLSEVHRGHKATKETKLKMSWTHFKRQGGELKKKTKAGYILVFSPEHPNKNSGSRVFEHRLIMENKLGRYLKPNELVHHLNGKKDDNKIKNLYLVKSNKEHQTKEIFGLTCPDCKRIIDIKI